jgi:hypothetical protein
MANEITINIPSISYVKPPYNDSKAPGILNVSVTGVHAVHDSVALASTAAALNKGNIGTIGFFYFFNLDPTNSCLVSPGTTDYFTIPPAGVFVGYAGVTTINAKATVGTPKLEYWFIEA